MSVLAGLSVAALLAAGSARAANLSTGPVVLSVCDDVNDPLTLDPHKEFAEKNHTLLQQMYEGLVRLDAQGRIEPSLAVSWERRDPLRMRFQLRPNVVFHDGEPFDAEAVRFSIARYLDPKTGFPALGFISSLDKVEIIDAHTVDIITKFPDGLLLNRLAGFILIVPPRYVADKGDGALAEHPVGTGPFKFVGWEKGRGVTMIRNESYWNPAYPKVDRLEFRFIPVAEQFEALKSGEIDVLTELPGTLTTEAVRTGTLKVIKVPSFYTVTGALDTGHSPLNDKRVRQALNHAINQEELIRYDLLGNGSPIATVTMSGEEGHNPELKPYSYDLKKARALLKAAGYPAGFTLKTLVKIQSERAGKIIAEQLGRIGVKLELRAVADADMIAALNSARWDIFISDCPDPMAHSYFIQSVFLSGSSPYSLGKDAVYDSMLQRMASTLDDGPRRDLAEKLDRYIYDESLLLFLYQRIKTYGVRKGVEFTPSITGMPYFYNVAKHGAS